MAGQAGPQGRRLARLKNLMMGAEKVVKLERGRDTRRLLGEAPGGAEPVGGPQPILLHAQAVPGTMNRPLVCGHSGGVQASSEKDDGSLGVNSAL